MRRVIDAIAAEHPDQVGVVDLAAWFSAAQLDDDHDVRPDGVHFESDAAVDDRRAVPRRTPDQDRRRVTTEPDVAPVVVYTDGACSGNPGPGGWAWAVEPDGEPRGSGGAAHTTNQRMELQAVLEALRALGVGSEAGPIVVVSDSTYVINCFRDRWWANWERNGWKNSKKQPVANADLWKPLVELVNCRAGDVPMGQRPFRSCHERPRRFDGGRRSGARRPALGRIDLTLRTRDGSLLSCG